MLVLLTSAIVGWPAATNPLNVFQTSVERVTAVTVGVILSGLAQGVFWPVTARGRFERSMRDLVTGCREILQLVRRGLLEQEMDGEAITKLESKVLSLSTTLNTTLEAARAESKQLGKYFLRYQQLSDELLKLFLTTTAISDASRQCARNTRAMTSDSASLDGMFDSIDKACVATIEQLSLPRDGTLRPNDSDNAPNDSVVSDMQMAHKSELEDAVATSLLRERLHAFGVVSTHVRTALAEVEDPHKTIQLEKAVPVPGPAPPVRMMKAALATLQVLLAAYFFVALNWPLGLQSAMLLVMIFAYTNAQLPVALVVRTIMKGVVIALPLAAVFHFVLMPRVDNFMELAPWLALLFFPLLYGVASHNPSKSLAAKLSVLLVNSLISVSTAPPSYDFASFVNAYLGMSGGVGVALLLAHLFETRSPRRGLHGVLSAVLSQSVDYLKECDDHSRPATERATLTKKYRKQSLSHLRQIKKLSAVVDYRKYLRFGRDQMQSVVHAFEVLVMRLIWSAALSPPPETEVADTRHEAHRAREWCVETLAATGLALGKCQPITVNKPMDSIFEVTEQEAARIPPTHDDGEGPTEDRHVSPTIASYYNSLSDAILDCQHELNAINWKRWSQNYF
jgi:uncharacterized membrane protein YccC